MTRDIKQSDTRKEINKGTDTDEEGRIASIYRKNSNTNGMFLLYASKNETLSRR